MDIFSELHTVGIMPLIVGSAFLGSFIIGFFIGRGAKKGGGAEKEIHRLADDLERANSRLKELDRLKTEFVSIASHQLRSPLAAVKGYASMLLEGSFGKLSLGAQEAIGRIFTSSSFMAHSVDDFLNVSRIELGRMRYESSKFDVCKIIDLVIEEQTPFAKKKHLELRLRNESGEDTCEIFADVGKVKQILTNLVDNAIKYTPHGSVTVVFNREEAQSKIHIAVIDTGMGMQDETLKEIFEKFSRSERANEFNVIGTGLGLYVVKNLAEGQGGRVWAESAGENKGSTFHVEHPYVSSVAEHLKRVR